MGRERCGGETLHYTSCSCQDLWAVEKKTRSIQHRHKHKENYFEPKRIPGCQCFSPVLMSPNLQFPGAGRRVGRSLCLYNVYIGVYLLYVQYFKNTGGHSKLFPLYSYVPGWGVGMVHCMSTFYFCSLVRMVILFLATIITKEKRNLFSCY